MLCRIIFLTFCHTVALAQHEMHQHADSAKTDQIQMTSAFSNNLPMSRDGSGTSWQPDAIPMWMHMIMKGNTSYMVHGTVFLRYTAQDITNESDRGDSQFDAPNMFMFVLSQKLNAKNLFSLFTMFSFDPLTVGESGYPLLLQTGESYKGIPLVDRQHPHDLFSGFAVNYTHSFSENVDVNTYFGYPGEPALGPVVFMHRVSAMNNPDAPLAHHWHDATHITFGVGTLGLRYKNIKAEGSIFTGREPDENRYDFDEPKPDSYSYRLSVNPNRNFSLQFSQGFIKSPEALFPDEDIIRTTASVMHSVAVGNSGFISTSVVWGMNSYEEKGLNSFLIESNWQLEPLAIYSRYEYIQKDAHELQLHQFTEDNTFNINAWTVGLNKKLIEFKAVHLSAGVQGTVNFPDKKLENIYGKSPLAAQVYIKLFPPPAHMHHN